MAVATTPKPKHRRTDLEALTGTRDGRHAPELVPIFGVKTFSAATTCADIHPHGPIPSGSRCVCMASCHKSGVDALVRDHTKPGNGQLREGWEVAEPTKYVPLEAVQPSTGRRLRGGIGR